MAQLLFTPLYRLNRNEKQGYLILHSKVSVHCKVKLPKFSIKPEFMSIPFPPHAAGPIRPTVILAEDEDK